MLNVTGRLQYPEMVAWICDSKTALQASVSSAVEDELVYVNPTNGYVTLFARPPLVSAYANPC